MRRKVFTGIETHAIIIINDDINSMEIIVNTLVRVLGISEKEAINLMFRTHEEGIAIAWTGNRNTAEENLMNIQRAGIRCYLTEILVSDV